MNLEEITEEGFLTRFAKKTRKVVLPLTLATSIITSKCDCNKKKETIIGPDNGTPKQEVVLTTSSTNQQGTISFTDNQTEEKVTVKVQDSQTKSPINNISIDYLDGKDFKAYYVQDPNKNYLPAVFVYPHNSEKLLELNPVVTKAFINQIIQGEEEHKALYSWKSETTNAWRDYAYVKTISKGEMLEQREVEYAIFDIAAEIATLIVGYNPLSEISEDLSLSDLIKLLDGWKYFKEGVIAERWDIYHVKGGSKSYDGRTIQFGAEYLDMIASNIPTLTLNDPKVEGSNVTLTWKGEDKTTYDNLSFFYTSQGFPKEDLTITQGSDPNKEDLTYFYKISKNNAIAFQDSTVNNYMEFKNLGDGNYNLEVLVQDEVGNRSDIITKNFAIQGIENKLFDGTLVFIDKELRIDRPTNKMGILHNSGKITYFDLNDPEAYTDVAFSPDGKRIAYTRNYNEQIHLCMMNRDGSNQHLVSNLDVRSIDWGVNNELAVEVFDMIPNGGIWLINSDGGELKLLSDFEDNTYSGKEKVLQQFNDNPIWSWNGSEIYLSKETYIGKSNSDGKWKYSIYSISPDGSNEKELISIWDEEGSDLTPGSVYNNELLYTMAPSKTITMSPPDFTQELWIFDLTNGTNYKIFEDEKTKPFLGGGGLFVYPIVSPTFIENGNRIIYFIGNAGYIINRDGSNKQQLSSNSMFNGDWTPYEF